LAGLALWHAPDGLTLHVHATAYDALRPGWQTLHAVIQRIKDVSAAQTSAERQRLEAELRETQQVLREQTERTQQLAAQLATAREPRGADAATGADSERLFTPALVEAAVLGETLSQDWRDGRVLDRGWKHGVREAALVLQGQGPLIDVGASAQITPADPLLVGRTIVGQVAVVGRWTSTFLPVTDPEFRGRAQLVRQTEQGAFWAAEGLLRGNGDGRCRLEGIPVEEAVQVGDLVYSAERDGAQSAALAYGRVIEARVSDNEREWSLVVEPAETPSRLTRVHVLRSALNPTRFWAN
jgi:cell shape-determining protein MreC